MPHDKFKKYRETHREKCRERCRKWRAKNLEAQRKRERESKRKRFEARREHVLALNRKWAKANPDIIRARDLRRKALKKGAPLGDTDLIKEWESKLRKLPFVRCHWCGTKVKGKSIHIDHVVALAAGGAHSIENLCASCRECNCSKQARALSDWLCKGQKFLSL